MSSKLSTKTVDAAKIYGTYFTQRRNAAGLLGLRYQKLTAAFDDDGLHLI
jgi:hypothetical protein